MALPPTAIIIPSTSSWNAIIASSALATRPHVDERTPCPSQHDEGIDLESVRQVAMIQIELGRPQWPRSGRRDRPAGGAEAGEQCGSLQLPIILARIHAPPAADDTPHL